MHRARMYEKEREFIRCFLCPRRCQLLEGQEGGCGVRVVTGGELYTINYGLCSAIHLDPIEKKPLYHFNPGSQILSLGTYGCNLFCSFCQNWNLARGKPEAGAARFSPDDVLEMLERQGGPTQVPGVAFTYNEPTIWYEFVCDTTRLLKEHGYCNVLVTNGYINHGALHDLLPYIDALNIDVKGFTNSFYQKYCSGMIKPVMETVETSVAKSHVEITCLLIPTLNDSPDEIERLACWLAGLSLDIPLHFSRYFPHYNLDLPPTPPQTLLQAREIALKHLRYVYLGNIDLPGSADTHCPYCATLLIARSRYHVSIPGLDGSLCRSCRNRISLVLPGG